MARKPILGKRSASPTGWLFNTMALAALAIGCAGAPFAAPIDGEPICPDVAIGAAKTKMRGGLRYPVRLRILDGKKALMKLVMSGKRAATEKPASSYIADDNAEYTLEWGQCPNEEAPRPVHEHERGNRAKEGGAYECGDAVVYKTEKLVTKRHDSQSHVITFVAPPNTECWSDGAASPVAPTPSAAPAPSASAPPAP